MGLREPEIYGKKNYADLLALIRGACERENIDVGFFQSNHEGAIVDAIQQAYGAYDGIVINPAAYTHTSVAILDALNGVAYRDDSAVSSLLVYKSYGDDARVTVSIKAVTSE